MLRHMTPADIPAAQALTASFGWPHRREDWAIMHALGQGFVAEQDGQLVGTALCWRYGADWGTLGMIAVDAAQQGRGLGRALMQAVLDSLGDRNIALNATPAGMPLYGTMGFKPAGMVMQLQGDPTRPDAMPPPPGFQLHPIAAGDLPAAAALDRAACGMDRTLLIAALLDEPDGIALVGPNGLAGFALRRWFGRGQLIGPVAAPDEASAQAMIAALLASRTSPFLRIDVKLNTTLSPWLQTLGLREVEAGTRMVRGQDHPPPSGGRMFALASQAFG